MKPVLLVFNMSAERLAVLKRIAQLLKAQIKEVPASGQQQTVAALLGAAPALPVNPMLVPFTEEMLLMSGLKDGQIDLLLNAWRQNGQSPVRLKAVVTPVNFTWTAMQLCHELKSEDAALH